MPHELIITPSGHLALAETAAGDAAAELSNPIVNAFAESPSRGLLHLATNALQARLPPPLEYARNFASTYLTRLCQSRGRKATNAPPPPPPPSDAELAPWVLQPPP